MLLPVALRRCLELADASMRWMHAPLLLGGLKLRDRLLQLVMKDALHVADILLELAYLQACLSSRFGRPPQQVTTNCSANAHAWAHGRGAERQSELALTANGFLWPQGKPPATVVASTYPHSLFGCRVASRLCEIHNVLCLRWPEATKQTEEAMEGR